MGSEKCIDVINLAMGRELSAEEVREIRESIQLEQRLIWNEDANAAHQMGKDGLLLEAARRAGEKMEQEAHLKKKRAALTITKHDQIASFLGDNGRTFDSLNNINAFSSKGGAGRTSAEYEGKAIGNMAIGRLEELAQAGQGKFLGFVQNKEDIRDFLKAVWGEATDNKPMVNVAKAWREVTEELRLRFNRAGGKIGSLGEKWYVPQHHDQARVAKATPEQWIADILPKLDRREYLNSDGTLMDEKQMVTMLGKVYDAIATGGASKIVPGKQSGTGMRANRNSESRKLFFRDADSYLAYHEKYGSKDIYNVLFDHLHTLSRDIAVTEAWGPNADLQFQFWKDTILQEQSMKNPKGSAWQRSKAWYADALYREVAGMNGDMPTGAVAGFLSGLRSTLVAARLGSAVISSFSDQATMRVTAHLWDIPEMTLLRNELAALNPSNKEELRTLRRAGLAINSFSAELNRFGSGFGTVPDNLAAGVMRASGLNALTDANKRAFGASMMNVLSDLSREKTFAQLEADDHRLLKWKGVDETTWNIWRLAQPEEWGDGIGALTPDAIRAIPDAALKAMGDPEVLRQKAATKLAATVLEEVDMAVIEPGARERAAVYAGTTRGTVSGEIMRSLMQFKMFPFSMISKHWQRALSLPEYQSKAMYTAALVASTTIMGAISMEVSELLAGRDPRKLYDPKDPGGAAKNWLAAAMKGGSLGIYGDFLFSQNTRYGQGPIAAMLGPTVGTLEEAYNLTVGNLKQSAAGEETDVGAELLRFGKGLTPGASLWYAKGAFDHFVVHDMQEYLSPGYLDRMKERTQRDFGQEYWWSPGENIPERAPELSEIAGG